MQDLYIQSWFFKLVIAINNKMGKLNPFAEYWNNTSAQQ